MRSLRRAWWSGLLSASLLASCSPESASSAEGDDQALSGASSPDRASARRPLDGRLSQKISTRAHASLTERLERDGSVLAIVELDPASPDGTRTLYGRETVLERRFGGGSLALLRVTSKRALANLVAHTSVAHVYDDRPLRAMTASSLPFIGQAQAASVIAYDADDDGAFVDDLGSFCGADCPTATRVGVALLDGRVDVTHGSFGCTDVGSPSESCRVVQYHDASKSPEGATTHATAMASIIHQVAPGADVYDVDITDGGSASMVSLLDGLSHVQTLAGDVQVVNISFGSTETFTSEAECEAAYGAVASKVDELNALGMVVVAASGNGGMNGLSAPACLRNVVSVGAVQGKGASGVTLAKDAGGTCSQSGASADQILCNSNGGAGLDLFAPGLLVDVDGEGGLPPASGTSVAAAHAAGALAVVMAAHGDEPESPGRAVSRLRAGGLSLVDARNGVTTPRLRMAEALPDCVGPYSATRTITVDDSGTPTAPITVETDEGCDADPDVGTTSWAQVDAPADGAVQVSASSNVGNTKRTGSVTAYGMSFKVIQQGDTEPPVISAVTLLGKGGELASEAGYTASYSVTARVDATDDSGAVSKLCAMGDADGVPSPTACSSGIWVSPGSDVPLTLLGQGDGTQYAVVWARDAVGNVSEPFVASIVFDNTDPSAGSLPALVRTDSPVGATFSPTGMTDTHFVGYRIAYRTDGTYPVSRCVAGTGVTVVDAGSTTPLALTGLVSDTTYNVRICASDRAGNVSGGLVTSFKASDDVRGPVGGAIDSDAVGIGFVDDASSDIDYTDGVADELLSSASGKMVRLVADDPSGIGAYCLSATPTCSSWTTVAATTHLDMTAPVTMAGDGTKTFYVRFRDTRANDSVAYTTSALLDTTAPSSGALAVVRGPSRVDLSLTGPSDTGSGVTHLRIERGATTPASNCPNGIDVPATFVNGVASITDTGLTGGTTYVYRVCAKDRAGNTAAGVTATVTATNDLDKPTGTVTLTGSAFGSTVVPGYSSSRTVAMTVVASDTIEPGVPNEVPPLMCVSSVGLDTTANCPATATAGVINQGWLPAANATLTLPTGDGLKTLFVKFKDDAVGPNNVSAVSSVSIRVDSAAPGAGIVKAAPTLGYGATLTWSGFADANGATYAVRVGDCATGELLSANATSPFTIAGDSSLTVPTTRSYCVRATDGSGQRSTNGIASAVLRSETTAPVLGTPTILPTCNGTTQCTLALNKKWTKNLTPPIAATLTDASLAGGKICYAASNNVSTCKWQALTAISGTSATSLPIPTTALAGGEAQRTYYVFAQDGMGNVTPTGKAASIYVDTGAPSAGTLTVASPTTTSVKLDWTKPTDAGAGVPASGAYTVCFVKGSTTGASTTVPTCNAAMNGCTKGTKLSIGSTALTYTHTGLTKGTYYSYALCRKDLLGNYSTLRKSVKTKAL